MPPAIGFIICWMLGVRCGIQWIRASRADRSEKLLRTIAALRAELAHERLIALSTWLQEDETP